MSLYSQSTIIVTPVISTQRESIDNWLHFNEAAWSSEHTTYLNETIASISIDEIRILKKELTYGVDQDKKKYIVILHADLLTLAAQNACLKLLEEPPARTYLILVTSALNQLLKTIQSRCMIITLESTVQEDFQPEQTLYKTIQKSTYGEIINLSEKYTQKDEALSMLARMVRYLHNEVATASPQLLEYANSITVCLKCIRDLEGNCNMKLAIGECFFSIKHFTSRENL